MTDDFAPSEEFTLLCDVPDCDFSLSMVSGVPRSKHGWGRVSLYREPEGTVGFPVAQDYDLCAKHYDKVLKALAGL